MGRKEEYGRIWTIVLASLFSAAKVHEVPDSPYATKNSWLIGFFSGTKQIYLL